MQKRNSFGRTVLWFGIFAAQAMGLSSDRAVVINPMTNKTDWVLEQEGDPGNNLLIAATGWSRTTIRLWANTLDSNDSKTMKSTNGIPYDITELMFDVRMDSTDTDLYICLQDFTGQWHESRVVLQDILNDFQTVVVKTFAGGDEYSYYGGAADGLWHGPMMNIGFRLRPGDSFPVDDQNRSVWIDDLCAKTVRVSAGGLALYLDDSELQDMIKHAAASGVKQYRLSLRWQTAEPSVKDVYNTDYLDMYDSAFDLMAGYQMIPSTLLIATPQWASANPTHEYFKYFRPADWADWNDFVSLMADRFGDQVYYWEGWNEPNIVSEELTGDPQDGGGHVNWFSSDAEYVELVSRIRDELEAAGNSFQLMNGGWGLVNGWDRVDSFLSLGLNGEIDIHNYHGYGDVYVPSGSVYARSEFVQELNATYGLTGETWITEFGYTRGTEDGGTNAQEMALQADYFDSYYYLHVADDALLPADRFVDFCFPDRGWVTGSGVNDWGLTMGSGWTPTKSFYHWQSMGGVAETDFNLLFHPDADVASLANTQGYQTLSVQKMDVVQNWNDPYLVLVPDEDVMAQLPVYVNDQWWFGDNDGLDVTAEVEVHYLDVADSELSLVAEGNVSPASVQTTGSGLLKSAVFSVTGVNFDNSLVYSADLDVVVPPGAADLPVLKVVVKKDRRMGVVFSEPYEVKYLNFTDENDPATLGYSVVTNIGGKVCRKITPIHYLHFRSTRANIPTSQSELYITVEYFDNGGGATDELNRIKLWYNSPASHYTANTDLVRAQTGTWKTHTWHLTDAAFNWQTPAYKTDFKIGNNQAGSEDVYIRSVQVSPEPPVDLPQSVPVGPVTLQMLPGAEQLALSWNSAAGSNYYVMQTGNLMTQPWVPWKSDIQAAGNQLVVTGFVEGLQGFYRVFCEE